jgi:hypothetical protein
MSLSSSFFSNNWRKYLTKANILKSTVGFIGSICTFAFAFKAYNQTTNANRSGSEADSIPFDLNDEQSIEQKLKNAWPEYIEVANFESLISVPRYQLALYFINQANRTRSREYNQRVIDELTKINLDHSKHDQVNGFANQISQLLNEDLMLELALKSPQCDSRFFRVEPPTTIQKIKKITTSKDLSHSSSTLPLNVYDDPDYGLIFEFYNNYASQLSSKYKKKSSPINTLVRRLNNEINSLILSDYLISDRSKLNVWSSEYLDEYDLEEEYDYNRNNNICASDIASHEINDKENSRQKVNKLKEKLKNEFIERNELLIMRLLEKIAKQDLEEFVYQMNGLEMLLLLYEKHKYDEFYLNAIGNCLCLASLNPNNKRLFIQSGWLRRLSEMCDKLTESSDTNKHLNLVRQLISHKILFNLNQKSTKNAEKLAEATCNLIFFFHEFFFFEN